VSNYNTLIGCIELLAENESLRREMGEAGRRRVLKDYNRPVIVRSYEELWSDLLQRGSRGSIDFDSLHLAADILNAFNGEEGEKG
jgi:hypothetical protein